MCCVYGFAFDDPAVRRALAAWLGGSQAHTQTIQQHIESNMIDNMWGTHVRDIRDRARDVDPSADELLAAIDVWPR